MPKTDLKQETTAITEPKRRGGRIAGLGNHAKSDGRFLIHSDDAAALMGLDPRGEQMLRESGDGPNAIKLGREYFYKRVDLDAWLGIASTIPVTN